jgi:hypothetical protein
MIHKHTWTRSPRKHKRPPRFFVRCTCGETRQAVISHGYLHTFTTGKKGVSEPMQVYPVRLPRKPTKAERKFFQEYIKSNPLK